MTAPQGYIQSNCTIVQNMIILHQDNLTKNKEIFMFHFFQNQSEDTEHTVFQPTIEQLANQLDFLPGNYAVLLRKHPTLRQSFEEQLDFYLKRFFEKDSTRQLTLGGGVGCLYNKNLHAGISPGYGARKFWLGGIYTDG